jgi:hypothetical protein
MESDKLKKDIAEWVLNWVSVHNESLGTVPCPFAKQALLNNKIDFATASDVDGIKNLCQFYTIGGLNGEVFIIGIDKNSVLPATLSNLIKEVNSNILMPAGCVALEDHPDDEEIINGVKMNQGTWALVLIQSLEKLNQASLILKKQGYYDNWTKESYDDVVSWRFNQST